MKMKTPQLIAAALVCADAGSARLAATSAAARVFFIFIIVFFL